MLDVAYARMLVAKGDLDAAMEQIDKGDPWIFNYQLLRQDSRLAPLRETERFQAFLKKNFPEKTAH